LLFSPPTIMNFANLGNESITIFTLSKLSMLIFCFYSLAKKAITFKNKTD